MAKGLDSEKHKDTGYAPAQMISGSTLRKMTEIRDADGSLLLDLWPVKKQLAEITAKVVEFKAANPGYTPAMLSEFTTGLVQSKFPGYDVNVATLNADVDKAKADYRTYFAAGRTADAEQARATMEAANIKLATYQSTVSKDVSRKKDGQYTCLDWAAMTTWVLNDSGEKNVSLMIGYYTDERGAGYHAAPIVFDGDKENPQPEYVVETTATPTNAFRKVVSGGDILKGDNIVTKHTDGGKPVLVSYGTRKVDGQASFNETMIAIAPVDKVKVHVYQETVDVLKGMFGDDITIRQAVIPEASRNKLPTEVKPALPKDEARLTIKRPLGLE